MRRRTKVVLLVGSLAVATVVVLWLAVAPTLSLALTIAQALPNHCTFNPRNLITGCNFKAGRTTTYQSTPIIPAPSSSTAITPSSPDAPNDRFIDETSWDITEHCTQGGIAKRLLCDSFAPPASEDLDVELSDVTGLPLPKGRLLTTQRNSEFIESVHVEMPLNLAAVLGFYRAELGKRGWTENDGAVVAPDHAAIAFTTSDGPALLRLIRQDDRTIADLSLRKSGAVAKADILPSAGHVKLRLGNWTDEEAVVTINEQTIKFAAKAKSADSPEIDLPPGKFKVTAKVAGSAAQTREFEVAADETWDLLVGPDGVPLPVHIY